jgi:hypothetical protein
VQVVSGSAPPLRILSGIEALNVRWGFPLYIVCHDHSLFHYLSRFLLPNQAAAHHYSNKIVSKNLDAENRRRTPSLPHSWTFFSSLHQYFLIQTHPQTTCQIGHCLVSHFIPVASRLTTRPSPRTLQRSMRAWTYPLVSGVRTVTRIKIIPINVVAIDFLTFFARNRG